MESLRDIFPRATYGFKIVLFNRRPFVHWLVERLERSLQHFSRRRFLRRSWRLILVVRRSFFKRPKDGQLPAASPAKTIEQTRSGRLKAWLQCPLRVTGRLFWIGGELLLAALSHAIHCAFRQRGSEAEFITEHYGGYTAQRDGSTMEYRVEHPRWRVWNTESARLDCDVADLYGIRFKDCLSRPPAAAFLAEGSVITVSHGIRLPA